MNIAKETAQGIPCAVSFAAESTIDQSAIYLMHS